jgi:hypothetical protein
VAQQELNGAQVDAVIEQACREGVLPEKLAAEERTMKHLIADCKLVMQEMDLIEAARADQAHTVNVRHGSAKG